MSRSIFAILISLACCVITLGQKALKGKIMASDTHKPVVSANIFLSTTSIGTISDEKGEFIIHRFPEGRFDLIISFIGYETYHVSVQSNHLPDNLEISLQPKAEELQEVIVESYDKNGWDKWGNIFIANFIGTSAFAEDCKLVNKDVIRFRFDKKNNSIKVTADDQLVIENKALGYILKYSLTKFEYNLDTGEFLYQGYPFFEEMKTDRKSVEKRWIENRQNAYYGSLMHFMRSLYQNKFREQQFEVRKWVAIPEEEKKRVKAIFPAQSKKLLSKRTMVIMDNGSSMAVNDDTTNVIHPDSLAYYKSIMQQLNQKNILINILLTADSLAFAIDNVTVNFQLDNQLQVLYRPKRYPMEYQKYIPRDAYYTPVTSQLFRTSSNPIVVLANGSFFDGINLMTTGYWAWWEKMCNKLPYEYWPPKK